MRVIGRDAATGSGLVAVTHAIASTGSTTSAFPNASSTGYSGTLTDSPGSMSIGTDSTTISDLHITGRVTVNADNVTIKNCFVDNPGDYYVVMVYGTNCTIEDCELLGDDSAQCSLVAESGATFTARRVNAHGCQDGITMNNDCGLYDSYIHDLSGDSSSHNDGVNADGYTGWTVDHCTILNDRTQTSCIWVGDPRNGASAGYLTNCLLAGGGYSVYAGPGTSDGIHVTGNQFSTRFFANGGYYGPVTSWEDTNNVWSDNTWADGPNAGQPVSSS